MGELVPFIARPDYGPDFSAADRARLDALAQRFSAAGEDVHVVFGATETGDPWFVLQDAAEDVLIHVARIGGRFVIHDARADALNEAADLSSALGARLQSLEGRGATILPFSRQAENLLALIAATSFLYEGARRGVFDSAAPFVMEGGDSAAPVAPAVPEAPAVAVVESSAPSEQTEAAPQADPAASHLRAPVEAPAATAVAEAPVMAHAAPAPAPPSMVLPEAPLAPDETALTPAVRDEPAPMVRVAGGDGDDRIELAANVVASGGGGADTFVIATPEARSNPNTELGAILDFRPSEGDRLIADTGHNVVVTGSSETTFDLSAFKPGSRPQQPSELAPAHKVELDLDGDGRPDGFIVMVDVEAVKLSGQTFDHVVVF